MTSTATLKLLTPQIFTKYFLAWPGVAQRFEHWPVNQMVADICTGYMPSPILGAPERQNINVSITHLCYSPCLYPYLPSLGKEVNTIFFKKAFINNLLCESLCTFDCLKNKTPQNNWHLTFIITTFNLHVCNDQKH